MTSKWESHSIGDLAKVKGGKRMPAGTALVEQRTTHPYLRIVDFREGTIDQSALLYVPDEVFPKISRYTIDSADVYISIVGTVGLVGQVPEELSGSNLTENAAKITDIAAHVLPGFLSYYLQSPEGQQKIREKTAGSTQPKLALYRIEEIPVPVPPLQQQISMISVLRALDERIENLRQTNVTLEGISQALFKSWFVDFDPVRAKAEGREPKGIDAVIAALFPSEFEESELGLIPKGWHAGVVAELAELSTSKWTSKKHPQTVKYVDLSGVHLNHYEANEFAFDEAPSRARNHLREGDTIVGTVRPGNRAFAYIYAPEQNLTGSTGFAVLSPKSPSFSSFVYLAATNDDAIARLANLADGGAYPAVRPTIVAETPCTIAREEVIEAFSAVTQPLLEKISQSNSMANVLIDIRDTLLPQLISGKLRLPDAEALIKDVTA